VEVTDSDTPASTDQQALSITVAPEDLVITTTSLPDGQVGVAYSQTLAATGGVTPYSWAVVSGSLPAGLSLNSSTGEISGTPTTAETANFTVEVTDSDTPASTDQQALSITVAPEDLVITTTAYSQTLAATGGVTPYSWSIISGALPAGLSLNSSTGEISGTPTTAETANFTVEVTDSQGTPDSDTKALSITIDPSCGDPTYWQASDDTESSTLSTTYQTKLTLQFTPTAADDYVIFAFAEHRCDGYGSHYTRMTVDGAVEGDEARRTRGNDWFPFAVMKVMNLTAAQHTIEIEYRSSGSDTAYIRRARIIALRKASLEWAAAAADSQQTITGTMTDFAALDFTPSSTGDYLLVWSAEVHSVYGVNDTVRAVLDGATTDEAFINNKGNDYEAAPFVSFSVASLDATQHTMKIQAQAPSGSGHWIRRCRLVAIRLTGGRFADYAYAADDTESETPSKNYVEKLSKSWTSGPTGNWLVLSSARTVSGGAFYGAYARWQYNDSTTIDEETLVGMDTTETNLANSIGVIDVTGSSRRVDVDYCTSASNKKAKIRYVHLAILPLD